MSSILARGVHVQFRVTSRVVREFLAMMDVDSRAAGLFGVNYTPTNTTPISRRHRLWSLTFPYLSHHQRVLPTLYDLVCSLNFSLKTPHQEHHSQCHQVLRLAVSGILRWSVDVYVSVPEEDEKMDCDGGGMRLRMYLTPLRSGKEAIENA